MRLSRYTDNHGYNKASIESRGVEYKTKATSIEQRRSWLNLREGNSYGSRGLDSTAQHPLTDLPLFNCSACAYPRTRQSALQYPRTDLPLFNTMDDVNATMFDKILQYPRTDLPLFNIVAALLVLVVSWLLQYPLTDLLL